jgi:hypothetical protein
VDGRSETANTLDEQGKRRIHRVRITNAITTGIKGRTLMASEIKMSTMFIAA